MTQEEKAKAYDEIIKKANKMHHENCEACQACIEELIPELKESEDERIRKELIDFIYDKTDTYELREKSNSWLAWLEKQEQKPAEWSSEQSKTLQTDNVSYKSSTDTHLWTRAIGFDGEPMESKPCEQKSSWSEEDEKQARQIERIVHNDGCTQKLQEQIANWFKSIKDKVQSQWKPSDEQMKALKEAVDKHFDIDGDALWHLYEDLKKLKD